MVETARLTRHARRDRTITLLTIVKDSIAAFRAGLIIAGGLVDGAADTDQPTVIITIALAGQAAKDIAIALLTII